MVRAFFILFVFVVLPSTAMGQFGSSPSTPIRWDLSGEFIRSQTAPPIEQGDEIGVFFNGNLVGRLELNSAQATSESYADLRVFGDDPNTPEIEGPALNDIISFQYFDESTNTTLTNVRALNSNGEPVNLAYLGGVIIPIPIPNIPTAPSQTVNLLISAEGDDNNNDNGNGNGSTPTGNPDVDGDGTITSKDAAMVLRVVIGGARTMDTATVARADVNGDGIVSTTDAIAVYKAM